MKSRRRATITQLAAPKDGNRAVGKRLFKRATLRFVGPPGLRNFELGLELLKQAAELGQVAAHAWLGAAYDYGLGTRTNRVRAFEHYLTAAKAGVDSEYNVAVCYLWGSGVSKNCPLGVRWLRKAIRHGDADAMHVLGQCYRWGRGLRRNPKKGFKLELAAARKGVVEAQFSAGVCLSRGEGTARDRTEAFKWYLKAAKSGHDDAAHNVGHYYEAGKGVSKNSRKAEYWYGRAAALRKKRSSSATA